MSGYVPCACRDCFDIAIGAPGSLCWQCAAAGCLPEYEKTPDESSAMYDCQVADAYGTEEER